MKNPTESKFVPSKLQEDRLKNLTGFRAWLDEKNRITRYGKDYLKG